MAEKAHFPDEKGIPSQLVEALRSLPELEAKVLTMRLGLITGKERTLEDVGKELGLIGERVRQIEAVALRKLKHPSIGAFEYHEPTPDYLEASSAEIGLKSQSKELETQISKENEPVTGQMQLPFSTGLLLIAREVSGSLVDYFVQHPEEMKTMDRWRFEELIAGLFDAFGYEVELTKRTRDGGVDIIALKDAEVSEKYLIQAKRPEPHNPIGVRCVREILGVKEIKRANKAILATTTYFSKPAIIESEQVKWDLELRDYQGLIRWFEDYQKIKSGKTTH